MSSEFVSRKKRTAERVPTSDGDHRKRRRNRTTQSCLNCHTSKRMCDRKRPACARCTQLGLTGLCVYEVDDPSQRSETQDESARLLKRVAELEGVIRELKNKPHPRWSQSACNSEEDIDDKWHSRAQARATLADQLASSRSAKSTPSVGSDTASPSSISSSVGSPSIHPQNSYPLSPSSSYYSLSPLDTPSPSTQTPTEEYAPSVTVVGQDITQDFDLSSIFSTYSGLMASENCIYNPVSKGPRIDEAFRMKDCGHCGCMQKSTNYNVVLELSLRLRKAADVLARATNHQVSSSCQLNRLIAELDTVVTNTLGNVSTSPTDTLPSFFPLDITHETNLVHVDAFGSGVCRPTMSTISPQSLHGIHSWDLMTTVADSPASCDDSFMTWEPHRR